MDRHYYHPHDLDPRTACGLPVDGFSPNGLDWTNQTAEVTCPDCLADPEFQEIEARDQYTIPVDTPAVEWGEGEYPAEDDAPRTRLEWIEATHDENDYPHRGQPE